MAPRKKPALTGDEVERMLGTDKPSDSELRAVATLADRALALTDRITKGQALLKELNDELNDLLTNKIPAAMAPTRMTEFTLDNGMRVKVEDFLHGSLPKEDEAKRREAIKWLTKHGGADLIKTQISTTFGAGEAENAKAVLRAIKALRLNSVEINQKEDVHPSSLKAFARERLRRGEEVPLDTLGLFAGRLTKFVAPAAPKLRRSGR